MDVSDAFSNISDVSAGDAFGAPSAGAACPGRACLRPPRRRRRLRPAGFRFSDAVIPGTSCRPARAGLIASAPIEGGGWAYSSSAVGAANASICGRREEITRLERFCGYGLWSWRHRHQSPCSADRYPRLRPSGLLLRHARDDVTARARVRTYRWHRRRFEALPIERDAGYCARASCAFRRRRAHALP